MAQMPSTEEMTQAFFSDIEHSEAIPANTNPRDAAQGVLCVLTQRVSGGEARDFYASMPQGMQELLRQCTLHREEPPGLFGKQEFLEKVAEHFDISSDQAEALSRAVFASMWGHLPRKELDDLESQLPPDMKEIWRTKTAH